MSARDALNFTIIQTLLMITLIIGAAVIAAAWMAQRQIWAEQASRFFELARCAHARALLNRSPDRAAQSPAAGRHRSLRPLQLGKSTRP